MKRFSSTLSLFVLSMAYMGCTGEAADAESGVDPAASDVSASEGAVADETHATGSKSEASKTSASKSEKSDTSKSEKTSASKSESSKTSKSDTSKSDTSEETSENPSAEGDGAQAGTADNKETAGKGQEVPDAELISGELTDAGGVQLDSGLKVPFGTLIPVDPGKPQWIDLPEPADEDGDKVLDEVDLCPGTPQGVSVTANGCEMPATAVKIPWGEPVPQSNLRSLPETGSVEANGFMNFVVNAAGSLPLVFRALESTVERLEHGFHVEGALILDVPGDTITLADAEVTFEKDSSGKITKLHGQARVPFPDFGAPQALELDAPIAQFGLEFGRNLNDLGAPLMDDREYLYFHFSNRLGAKYGALSVELPAGSEHTLVLDHTDPMFVMRASIAGIPGVPAQISDAGIGFSRQGLIPAVMDNTWGLPANSPAITEGAAFYGQMYVELGGGVSIPGLPIALTGVGTHVLDIDPGRTGRTVFTDPASGFRVGVNRELGISLDLIPSVASLNLDMARASLDALLAANGTSGAISGVVYPNKSFLNDVIPITPLQEVKAALTIADPLSDSRFALQGSMSLALSRLDKYVGISLKDVQLLGASLSADKNGLFITGTAQAPFIDSIGLGSAGARFSVNFPGNAEVSNWYVDVTGQMRVSGVQLSGDAYARLDRTGVTVRGKLAAGSSFINMAGQINRNGANLRGTANVNIPITLPGREQLQEFVGEAQCAGARILEAGGCVSKTINEGACKVVNGIGSLFGAEPCKVVMTCTPVRCEKTVRIPAQNLGSVTGTLNFAIGTSGLSHSLTGQFCGPGGSSCQSVTLSSVDINSHQVCVQVPGVPQTFCAPWQ